MKTKNKLVITFLTLINLNPVAFSENNDLASIVTEYNLSLATALQAAEVSVVSCRKQGLHVSAAVVDSSGLLQVLLRDTNATPISTKHSQRKAYTAANFLKDTTQLSDLSNTAIGRSEGVLMSAGGVLIKVGGVVYGAIGVSGASTGAKDDECAKAGFKAIADDLIKAGSDEGKKNSKPTN